MSGWLNDRMIHWSIDSLIHWLIDWLIDWLNHWMIDWLNHRTTEWLNAGQELAEPTPRAGRIGHDYCHEFPRVEVESRRVTSAAGRDRSASAADGPARGTAAAPDQTATTATEPDQMTARLSNSRNSDNVMTLPDEEVRYHSVVYLFDAFHLIRPRRRNVASDVDCSACFILLGHITTV